MQITRRDTLFMMTAATALALCGTTSAGAAEGDRVDVAKLMAPPIPDHPLGSADAPVTVIEYASPTCPHCAAFHTDVLPSVMSTYVDTGKVRFIVRPFVRNIQDAVVFMLAEAAGPENYYHVLDTYFRTQSTWGVSEQPRDALLAVALQLGFTPESFDQALTNQELFTAMEQMRDQALEEFKLEGTPTFYVNGKQLTGDKTLEQLAAEIEPLLPEALRGGAPVTPADASTPTTTTESFTPVAPEAGAAATTTTTTAPATPAAATTTAAPAATTTTAAQ